MRDILNNMDVQDMRAKVFNLYGLPESTPRNPSHRVLQKAHYTYMIDKEFMQQVREIKQAHERFMTAILGSDVFPQLERVNPLQSTDLDEIPSKFGKNWFEEQRNDRVFRENGADDNLFHIDEDIQKDEEKV